jgi:hypothetical protein
MLACVGGWCVFLSSYLVLLEVLYVSTFLQTESIESRP